MSEFLVSADDLRRLARLVETHALSELRYDDGELRITLRTTPVAMSATPLVAAVSAPISSPTPAPAAAAAGGQPINAPIMGIFYRAPAPGAPHFVEVGDTVEVGQAIGMIEAMKTFSEVLAETAGKVLSIPAENGKLVQPGDVLVLLEPAA